MSDPQKILFILFLKATPQDLSYSSRLAVQLVVIYVFSALIVLQTTLSPEAMLPGVLLGLFMQFAFTWLVLRLLDKRARFLQTFCAIMGVGIIFNLLSWPMLSVLSNEAATDALKSTMSLMFLMIISWEVLVKAHIFLHALDMKMFSAMALSFSLLFLSVALSQIVFPA